MLKYDIIVNESFKTKLTETLEHQEYRQQHSRRNFLSFH
jgi:hypothetical protein